MAALWQQNYIGRNAAVADFGSLKFAGFPAWLAWLFIHFWFLIEFDNKLLVLIQWAWNYFTRKRGARLITGEDMGRSPEQSQDNQRLHASQPQAQQQFKKTQP